jgi:SAM-dependent methyltransferase
MTDEAGKGATVDEAAFWETAYREGRDRWELGAAAPPLVRAVATLPVGERAIVLGCGRGHEAHVLAQAGWREVVAVDFAPSALAEAQRLAASDPVASRIEWRLQDVFTLGATDAGRFDLVVEHTCFCAIDPARRADWLATVRDLLRPGGRLLALFFAHGRPGGPPFTTSREEIEKELRAANGFAIERLEVPSDSVPARRGEELLVVATRV